MVFIFLFHSLFSCEFYFHSLKNCYFLLFVFCIKFVFIFNATGCFLRPVVLSLPYLLFLLYLPFVPVASSRSIRGNFTRQSDFCHTSHWLQLTFSNPKNYSLFYTGFTGYYLKLLIFVSFALCALQVAFQVLLAVLGNEFIVKCDFIEILLRHVGVVRLDSLE